MAAQNPWAQLASLDPATQQLALKGMQGLEAGKISPEEAKAHAASLMGPPAPYGPPEPPRVAQAAAEGQLQPTNLLMGNLPNTGNALDVNQVSPAAPRMPALTGTKREREATQKNSLTSKTNTLLTPEQMAQAQEVARGTPEFQDLQSGEKRMQDLINMTAQQRSGDPGWVKPLLSLSDSQTGSKLLDGYTPGLTGDQRNAEILKYTDELQKRKADVAKAFLQAQTAQKNGGTNVYNVTNGAKTDNTDTTGNAGGRGSAMQENAFLGRISRESKDLRSQDQVLTNVSKLLAQWNPSADPEIKTQLARIIEGTVRPQMAVIGASGGDTSVWQSLLNTAEKIGSGKMTAEQRGQYMKEIQAVMGTHQEAAAALKKSWGVQNRRLPNPYSAADLADLSGTATPGGASAATSLAQVAEPKNIGAPGRSATKPVHEMTEAEIDAELAKHGSK